MNRIGEPFPIDVGFTWLSMVNAMSTQDALSKFHAAVNVLPPAGPGVALLLGGRP